MAGAFAVQKPGRRPLKTEDRLALEENCTILEGLAKLDEKELDEVYQPLHDLARTTAKDNASQAEKIAASQRVVRASASMVQKLKSRGIAVPASVLASATKNSQKP